MVCIGKKGMMIWIAFIAVVLVSGCMAQDDVSSIPDDNDDKKIDVVVSILPLADFVEKIGADKVEVTVMVPPLASPETYEPTPSQLKTLSLARMHVMVGSGIPFEESMDKAGRDKPNIVVANCSNGITIVENDPHVWMSLRNAGIIAKNIYDGLASADPVNKEYYYDNYNKYLIEIDMLDMQIQNMFNGADKRTFMILHPSFGYFARDYGLVQVAIEDEGKEPSSSDVLRLIEYAKENGIKTIFVQPGVNFKNAQAIASEINGTIALADPLAEDYLLNMRNVSKSLAESMR
ncbi:MAG: zinc ABC transporter substrate-binding protein [archaeon]